jgi:hypothetical protein
VAAIVVTVSVLTAGSTAVVSFKSGAAETLVTADSPGTGALPVSACGGCFNEKFMQEIPAKKHIIKKKGRFFIRGIWMIIRK